jgi:hypothetical protein
LFNSITVSLVTFIATATKAAPKNIISKAARQTFLDMGQRAA